MVLISALQEQFIHTDTIVVACAGLEIIQTDAVLYVIADLLTVDQGTCLLGMQ